MKNLAMKNIDSLFLLLCIGVMSIISTGFICGYLSSPIAVSASWLIGLAIVVVVAVWIVKYLLDKIERFLPQCIEVYRLLTLNITQCPINQAIGQKSQEEIERIGSKTFDEEVAQVLPRVHFRKMIGSWDRPDAIATFHAIESLRILSFDLVDKKSIIPLKHKFFDNDNIRKSIIERFNYVEGSWYANNKNSYPSLDAAYATIKMAKNILTFNGKEHTCENFCSVLGEKEYMLFQAFLKQCMDKDTGGFRDFDEDKPTLGSTGLAIRICSILYNNGSTQPESFLATQMNDIFDFKQDATPWNFISKCLTEIDLKGKRIKGFSERMDNNVPLVCSTYFAASSLETLGKTELITNDKESTKLIASFLDECMRLRISSENNQKTRGFAAAPTYDKEDLMHTYYALRTAEILCPKYLKKKDKKFFFEIGQFVAACKSGDGYAFTKNWAPNVFATCLARNVYSIIKKVDSRQDESFDEIGAIKFYRSCYNCREFAFAGYPLEPHI